MILIRQAFFISKCNLTFKIRFKKKSNQKKIIIKVFLRINSQNLRKITNGAKKLILCCFVKLYTFHDFMLFEY